MKYFCAASLALPLIIVDPRPPLLVPTPILTPPYAERGGWWAPPNCPTKRVCCPKGASVECYCC